MDSITKYSLAMIVFYTLNLFAAETNMPLLKAPNLKDDMIEKYHVGLRPYRNLGVRIEREEIDNKIIIHNYGHGGAGITLSWGSALSAIDLMEEPLKDDETIAVIGAGVIGLSTAVRLSDIGYKVRIYAKDFTPNTTSDIAGAHWAPFLVACGEDVLKKQQFEHIKTQSESYFHDLTKSNARFAGVSLVKAYYFDSRSNTNNVQVKFDNGKSMWAKIDDTILINTNVYLDSLMTELRKQKVVFKHINLTSEDITKLQEKIIFNCSGIGANKLFSDANISPIRGYLIEFKPQPDVDYFAVADFNNDAQYFTCLFSHENKLLIGGSIEENKWNEEIDEEVCARILIEARNIFEL